MKAVFFILALTLSTAGLAHANQVCSRVDDADDWRLSFDFAAGKVNFFDNDKEVTGTYQYSLEMVGGADVYSSDDSSDPWTATYYGNREGNGNRAVLTLGEGEIEFVCRLEK